ncbi:MAG: lipoate--protein ligase family protein [Thermoguttaceae bacterium]
MASGFQFPTFLLLDPPAAGAWNMAVDEALLESAASDGRCTLRFYQWQEPTLSLGYFQTYADRWRHEPSRRAAAVRRASGGGAILHDHELTYSFAVPSDHPLAVDRLGFYRAVHQTLIETLSDWGVAATMFAESSGQPDPREPGCADRRMDHCFLCFQRRAPGDVLVGQAKVAGSAQRRCQGAVLQHGSVLLARSDAAPELDGLEELSGRRIAPQSLVEAWLKRLTALVAVFERIDGLSPTQRRRAEQLAVEKYGHPSWTERRGRA